MAEPTSICATLPLTLTTILISLCRVKPNRSNLRFSAINLGSFLAVRLKKIAHSSLPIMRERGFTWAKHTSVPSQPRPNALEISLRRERQYTTHTLQIPQPELVNRSILTRQCRRLFQVTASIRWDKTS